MKKCTYLYYLLVVSRYHVLSRQFAAERATAKKCFKCFTSSTPVQLSTGLLSLKTSKY